MRNGLTLCTRPPANLPAAHDYALFRLHDGVTQGTSTSTGIADANPDNTWTLSASNFNAAQWTDRPGWWTGTLASDYALTCDISGFLSESTRFAADAAFDGAAYLVACMLNLPAYATAAQRLLCLGVNNNADRFQLRYVSGDILQFLVGDNDVVTGSIDITAQVDTDLVFVALIDDRAGVETAYARVYEAGSTNLVNAVSASTSSVTWLTSASARYLQVGSLPNTPGGSPLSGSVRRVLLCPFGSSPPSDFIAVAEELALYNLTRFDTL